MIQVSELYVIGGSNSDLCVISDGDSDLFVISDSDRGLCVITDRSSDLSAISGSDSDRDLCEPGMQVNSISFFEHHVLEGGGETSGRSDAAAADRLRRQCVMEAEVTNRTDGPLQVIICTRFCLLSSFSSSSVTYCCSCKTAQMHLC